MGSRESEYLILPVKVENSPNGSTGGKEVPEHGTVGGKDGEDTVPQKVSQRNSDG